MDMDRHADRGFMSKRGQKPRESQRAVEVFSQLSNRAHGRTGAVKSQNWRYSGPQNILYPQIPLRSMSIPRRLEGLGGKRRNEKEDKIGLAEICSQWSLSAGGLLRAMPR